MISKPSALPRDVRSLQRMVIEKEALLSERAQTIAEREAQLAERDRVIAVPRGGRALLAGLICCAHCGRRLSVLYTGRYPRPVYRCEQPNLQLGSEALPEHRRQAHRREHRGRDAARRGADGYRGG